MFGVLFNAPSATTTINEISVWIKGFWDILLPPQIKIFIYILMGIFIVLIIIKVIIDSLKK